MLFVFKQSAAIWEKAMKPESFKKAPACEYCKHISFISHNDAWCMKHEFDVNGNNETHYCFICDDFEMDQE